QRVCPWCQENWCDSFSLLLSAVVVESHPGVIRFVPLVLR
ncbi:hypothetical protein A2U01_0095127, partial [Trifolium medium]|nr:hypothetical protein [Trifolium medium]